MINGLPLWANMVLAFLATFGFGVLFQAPKKEWIFCGISGTIGWIVYFGLNSLGLHLVAATIVAVFALTVFSRILAVLRRQPGTIYLLTGIFTLVPGAGIYYTAFYMITGELMQARAKGQETVEIAVAIVVGIIFAFALPQSLFNLLGKREKNRGDKESSSRK